MMQVKIGEDKKGNVAFKKINNNVQQNHEDKTIDVNDLDDVFHVDTHIHAQIERAHSLKHMDSNQIIDNIYKQAAIKSRELFKFFKAIKDNDKHLEQAENGKFFGDQTQSAPQMTNKTRQKLIKKFQEIVDKINKQHAVQEEFNQLQYFKFVRVESALDLISEKHTAAAKLAGRVSLNISTSMSGPKRVEAYTCEEYAYYLYQKGFMKQHFKELDKQALEEAKRKVKKAISIEDQIIKNSMMELGEMLKQAKKESPSHYSNQENSPILKRKISHLYEDIATKNNHVEKPDSNFLPQINEHDDLDQQRFHKVNGAIVDTYDQDKSIFSAESHKNDYKSRNNQKRSVTLDNSSSFLPGIHDRQFQSLDRNPSSHNNNSPLSDYSHQLLKNDSRITINDQNTSNLGKNQNLADYMMSNPNQTITVNQKQKKNLKSLQQSAKKMKRKYVNGIEKDRSVQKLSSVSSLQSLHNIDQILRSKQPKSKEWTQQKGLGKFGSIDRISSLPKLNKESSPEFPSPRDEYGQTNNESASKLSTNLTKQTSNRNIRSLRKLRNFQSYQSSLDQSTQDLLFEPGKLLRQSRNLSYESARKQTQSMQNIDNPYTMNNQGRQFQSRNKPLIHSVTQGDLYNSNNLTKNLKASPAAGQQHQAGPTSLASVPSVNDNLTQTRTSINRATYISEPQAPKPTDYNKMSFKQFQTELKYDINNLTLKCDKINKGIAKDVRRLNNQQAMATFMQKQQNFVSDTINEFDHLKPSLLDIVVLGKLYDLKEHNEDIAVEYTLKFTF